MLAPLSRFVSAIAWISQTAILRLVMGIGPGGSNPTFAAMSSPRANLLQTTVQHSCG